MVFLPIPTLSPLSIFFQVNSLVTAHSPPLRVLTCLWMNSASLLHYTLSLLDSLSQDHEGPRAQESPEQGDNRDMSSETTYHFSRFIFYLSFQILYLYLSTRFLSFVNTNFSFLYSNISQCH